MRNSVEGDGPVNPFLLMRPQSFSHFVGELSLCDPLTQISLHTAKNLKSKAHYVEPLNPMSHFGLNAAALCHATLPSSFPAYLY